MLISYFLYFKNFARINNIKNGLVVDYHQFIHTEFVYSRNSPEAVTLFHPISAVENRTWG